MSGISRAEFNFHRLFRTRQRVENSEHDKNANAAKTKSNIAAQEYMSEALGTENRHNNGYSSNTRYNIANFAESIVQSHQYQNTQSELILKNFYSAYITDIDILWEKCEVGIEKDKLERVTEAVEAGDSDALGKFLLSLKGNLGRKYLSMLYVFEGLRKRCPDLPFLTELSNKLHQFEMKESAYLYDFFLDILENSADTKNKANLTTKHQLVEFNLKGNINPNRLLEVLHAIGQHLNGNFRHIVSIWLKYRMRYLEKFKGLLSLEDKAQLAYHTSLELSLITIQTMYAKACTLLVEDETQQAQVNMYELIKGLIRLPEEVDINYFINNSLFKMSKLNLNAEQFDMVVNKLYLYYQFLPGIGNNFRTKDALLNELLLMRRRKKLNSQNDASDDGFNFLLPSAGKMPNRFA